MPGERGMRGIEGHDIRARACLEPQIGPREGLGAAGQRSVEQRAAGRNARTAGQHVALPVLQPLAIFELTQLAPWGHADQHVGVCADAEPAAGVKEVAGRENTVAEARLGNRAEACCCAAAGKRGDLGLGCMGRMDQAPAPIDGRMFEQPLDRPPARPCDAFLDLPGLFGGVDVPARLRRVARWPPIPRRHGAQAVRGDTEVAPGNSRMAICSRQPVWAKLLTDR